MNCYAIIGEGGGDVGNGYWVDMVASAIDTFGGAREREWGIGLWGGSCFRGRIESCFSVVVGAELEIGALEERDVGDRVVVTIGDAVAYDEVVVSEELVVGYGRGRGVWDGDAEGVCSFVCKARHVIGGAVFRLSFESAGCGICEFSVQRPCGFVDKE